MGKNVDRSVYCEKIGAVDLHLTILSLAKNATASCGRFEFLCFGQGYTLCSAALRSLGNDIICKVDSHITRNFRVVSNGV